MHPSPAINSELAILGAWNGLDANAAAAAILPCNGSRAWAAAMAALRPISSPQALFEASEDVWRTLSESAWQQAFDSHPRIGEHKAQVATAASLAWSSAEQSTAHPDASAQASLAAANLEYEAKFGRIFIICATGKTAANMLAILRQRLENDPQTELLEAAAQQSQITHLRLCKWLGLS